MWCKIEEVKCIFSEPRSGHKEGDIVELYRSLFLCCKLLTCAHGCMMRLHRL